MLGHTTVREQLINKTGYEDVDRLRSARGRERRPGHTTRQQSVSEEVLEPVVGERVRVVGRFRFLSLLCLAGTIHERLNPVGPFRPAEQDQRAEAITL